MGQVISAIKNSLKDPEEERKANDALNSLQQLAGSKLDKFYTEIKYATILCYLANILDRPALTLH
jgi:hypothetical protein